MEVVSRYVVQQAYEAMDEEIGDVFVGPYVEALCAVGRFYYLPTQRDFKSYGGGCRYDCGLEDQKVE